MLKDLKDHNCDDFDLNRFQDYVKQYVQQLNATILDGNLIKQYKQSGQMVNVVLGTTTVMVPHGLNREYQGWQLLDLNADARVWRDSTVDTTQKQNSKTLYLPLKASAACTVVLWVF